jgi:hypothetical protein
VSACIGDPDFLVLDDPTAGIENSTTPGSVTLNISGGSRRPRPTR